jgi:hypothetical protein
MLILKIAIYKNRNMPEEERAVQTDEKEKARVNKKFSTNT